jgi:hypothetical protein
LLAGLCRVLALLVQHYRCLQFGLGLGASLERVCSGQFRSILRGLGTCFSSVLKFFVTVACVNCRLLYENSLVGQIPSELGMLQSLTQWLVGFSCCLLFGGLGWCACGSSANEGKTDCVLCVRGLFPRVAVTACYSNVGEGAAEQLSFARVGV